MKLSILQENLVKGLSTASRMVAARAQLPVLSNVRLSTDKGQLKLSATNLETGVNLWVGAKVDEEGALCVPAKILTEYVLSLPAGKIDLSVDENSLFLKSNGYQANFVGLPASEFPDIPGVQGEPEITLPAKNLAAAINQVAFAAAVDDSRPVLTGILLRVQEGKLVIVGTDGYRLGLKRLEGTQDAQILDKLKNDLLIPAHTLVEVAKMIASTSEEIPVGLQITPGSNQVIFAIQDCEILSRLIEGQFPDFEKIIPAKGTTKVVIEVASFLSAVRTAAIFARDSANIVKLKFEGGKVKISANAAQVGDNLVEVEAKQEGDDNNIAFNYRYLLDYLNSVTTELVRFEMTSPLSPGVFAPEGDATSLHLIMPVRVQE